MAMNKKDMSLLVVLLALLFAWPMIDHFLVKNFYPERLAKPAAGAAGEPEEPKQEPELAPAPEPVETVAEQPAKAPVATVAEEAPAEQPAERRATLENDNVAVVLSSRGGTVATATLKKYPRTLDPDSGHVVLDFADRRALAYEGLAGLGDAFDFAMTTSDDGRSVSFERKTAGGLRLKRTVTLGDRYLLEITDEFVNESANPLTLTGFGVRVGGMTMDAPHHAQRGIVYLGVDTLSPGGEKVQHWGNRLGKLFSREMEEGQLDALPLTIDLPPRENPVDWVAAKNKYFVEILTPEGGADRCRIFARRERSEDEIAHPGYPQKKMTSLAEVGVAVNFAEQALGPGDKIERNLTYYVGPKKYTELYAMRMHQLDVMEFGMWAPVGKVLLRVLNFIHDYLPPYNYGVAIILLTIIVRVIFWPITHKSTESMKRMQQVAPLVNKIREKYKDNPQKQQQEIMALYKEHKVNPLSGCLPMLIQIPVFIALFVVLRSAIELRFASFLWIRDLSEPENLFPGVFPFAINILPILMAVTMFLQMKLSPSSGDPSQQKIMAYMMPAMMLVFLYNFASGLALYWTTQNLLMIAQQMLMKRRAAAKAAAAA